MTKYKKKTIDYKENAIIYGDNSSWSKGMLQKNINLIGGG